MCTNLRLIAKDNSVVVARTMDLNIDLKSQLLVFPKEYSITSRAPSNKPGHSWKTKHGFVGVNGMATETVTDGLNDAGVYAGALYLPGFTKYQNINSDESSKALAPIDVVMFLLSHSSSVDEAKELIKTVIVWEEITPEVGFAFPLHFVVHDKSGACAVFEYVDGHLQIHDNPLGVLTNSPTFDWHLTNLRNFVNISPVDAIGKNIAGMDLSQLGEGSGMLGLPGDFTPPSRFVRAVALTQSVYKPKNSEAATQSILHVINNFDLVMGVERNLNEKKDESDYTQWTTITDLANGSYYIRMHNNPIYGQVKIGDLDFGASKVKVIDPNQKNWATNLQV